MALVNFKDEVLVRVYSVTLIVMIVALTVIFRAAALVSKKGEYWRKEADKKYIQVRDMPGERGNILAEDGSLLATSIPYFTLHMDFTVPNKDEFVQNMDSMAYILMTTLTPQESNFEQWRQFLWSGLNSKDARYVLLAKEVNYDQLQRIKNAPLFRKGQYRSGLIATRNNKREHPFKSLALRTLGYVKDGTAIGLEGRFDEVLNGGSEKVPMMRVGGDMWMPLEDLTDIQPRNGKDIVTTIDVNIQDVTHNALMRTLEKYQAENGVAIVMEVKTGKIKAISNLGRSEQGDYFEDYNYAVARSIEPGSTWKLASMMALLEDGKVRLSDTVDIESGRRQYAQNAIMEDHEKTYKSLITVREAFAGSSNVGISKLVYQHFDNRRETYLKHLQDFYLTLPTGVEVDGEAPPYIKKADDASWSGITLPWMSIGYELKITPLQLLTFYNAVANNGTMLKPYLVSEWRSYGKVEKTFKPTILSKSIASKSTIEQARVLLESVVELPMGTAAAWRTPQYRFAGKTGTAQLDYIKKGSNKTNVGGYQASFVGYFPAENPVYSCIVVVSKPKGGYYGGIVAAPVFREIADKLMASNTALSEPVNQKGRPVLSAATLPDDVGYKPDLLAMLEKAGLKHEIQGQKEDNWVFLRARNDTLFVLPRQMLDKKGTNMVPSVVGMGLKDALYVLENRGMKVSFSGYGKVVSQSLQPGALSTGQRIVLKLE